MYGHFLFLVWVVRVWIFLPTDDEAETWFEKKPRPNPTISHGIDPIRTELRVKSSATTKSKQRI
jgi:hypothetical protein